MAMVAVMLVGILSDIHANLTALGAVLADMPKVDRLLFLGDAVGYYAQPNEVCDRLREVDALAIRGNHDAYVTGAMKPDPAKSTAYRIDWTRQALTKANLEWLSSLGAEERLTIDSVTLIMRHASPWDEQTYLYPDSPALQSIDLAGNELLCVGHTHWPMSYPAGAGVVINPGSVGQPRDWNPDAAYAILSLPDRNIQFCRVPYDVAAVQADLRKRHWTETSIEILSRKRIRK
jgi:putative phosphoesterase